VSLLDVLHGRLIFGRRVDRLADAVAARLPPNATVLDIGCGDGSPHGGRGTDPPLYPQPLSAVFGRGVSALIDLGTTPSTFTLVDMVDPGT
jgi:hypothetical protein